jgi:hypothetical protein
MKMLKVVRIVDGGQGTQDEVLGWNVKNIAPEALVKSFRNGYFRPVAFNAYKSLDIPGGR